MAHKTYELKMLFTIDDTNQHAVEIIAEMKEDILSGKAQRELTNAEDGVVKVMVTINEIK